MRVELLLRDLEEKIDSEMEDGGLILRFQQGA